MTAKQYLQQIYRLRSKIRIRREQLATLKASAAGFHAVDYSADRVQSTPDDHMANAVGKYADMEAEINHMIDDYFNLVHRIIGQIEGIQNAQLADILYARYVKFETLGKIANDLHYEYSYCCRLHGRALKEFGRLYLDQTSQTKSI